MKRLVGYFARGCLTLIPLGATFYVLWLLVTATDALLGISIPGLGLIVVLALIVLIGFLVSNVIGKKIYDIFDRLMERLPVVTLLYTSIRDLLQAFVGENKKTIGKPVALRLTPASETRILGLLTRNDLSPLGMPDHVAVYVPQAYNIGGQVLAVHRDQIEPIDVSSSEMLAFMMSGGAAGFGKHTPPPPTVDSPPFVS